MLPARLVSGLLARVFRPEGVLTGFKTRMDRKEALLILDVSEDRREAIEKAYKHLILRNHPDHGGSEYLASKINQARGVLLRRQHK